MTVQDAKVQLENLEGAVSSDTLIGHTQPVDATQTYQNSDTQTHRQDLQLFTSIPHTIHFRLGNFE
jgi:hypothetical protein